VALLCNVLVAILKAEVSSKMTYNFYWPDGISIFFRKLFVIYFIKNYHSKVKFEAKNDLLKVGV